MKLIALILIVVVLSNSVTSCILVTPWMYAVPVLNIMAITVDLALAVGIIGMIIGISIGAARGAKQKSPGSTKPGGDIPDRVDPDKEDPGSIELDYNPFKKTFFDLPATQTGTLIQKMRAVDETEMSSFMETFYAMPEMDKVTAFEQLNALSAGEVQNIVWYLNSLSEMEFTSLLRRELQTPLQKEP